MDLHDDMKAAAEVLKPNAFRYTETIINYLLDYSIKRGLGLTSTGLHKAILIAGGCFASHIQGDTPKDIDVYILKTNDHVYIENSLAGLQPFEIVKDLMVLLPSFTSDNKVQNDRIISSRNYMIDGIKFNIINTTFVNRDEVLAQFDYQHTKFAYHESLLYFSEKSFICAKTKALVACDGKKPATYRREKFLDRGYTEGPLVNPYNVSLSSPSLIPLQPGDIIRVSKAPWYGIVNATA